MKKGIIRIVIGLILMFLQLLSIIGNLKMGVGYQLSFDSLEVFLFDLGVLFFSNIVGIVGTILAVWGLIARRKSN